MESDTRGRRVLGSAFHVHGEIGADLRPGAAGRAERRSYGKLVQRLRGTVHIRCTSRFGLHTGSRAEKTGDERAARQTRRQMDTLGSRKFNSFANGNSSNAVKVTEW